jgi:hypothetical protein
MVGSYPSNIKAVLIGKFCVYITRHHLPSLRELMTTGKMFIDHFKLSLGWYSRKAKL